MNCRPCNDPQHTSVAHTATSQPLISGLDACSGLLLVGFIPHKSIVLLFVLLWIIFLTGVCAGQCGGRSPVP